VNGRPCPERLLLPEALSAQLPPAEEKRVMAHLETCAACQDAAADIEVALVSLTMLRVSRDEGAAEPDAVRVAGLEAADRKAADLEPAGLNVVTLDRPRSVAAGPAAARQGAAYRLLRPLLVAAAALLLVGGGAVVGHQLLPPRDSVHYGPSLALAPPAGAADTAARGSVAVAADRTSLAVKLKASALPAAGWYECVWIAGGETRSAGSFHATGGAVDVDLRVAAPKAAGGWDLQVLAHDASGTHVVLEGNTSYPS
jgi:hypothetical protein